MSGLANRHSKCQATGVKTVPLKMFWFSICSDSLTTETLNWDRNVFYLIFLVLFFFFLSIFTNKIT